MMLIDIEPILDAAELAGKEYVSIDFLKGFEQVDAVPVVRGEWIHGCHDGAGTEFCYCSECNEDALKDKSGYTEFSAFCPSCGAKMGDKQCGGEHNG